MALPLLPQNQYNSIFRTDSFSWEQNYTMMEKRQLFLRSYQFCRKKSLGERIKISLVRAKRVMWFRLRSARKLRKLVLSKLRSAFYCRRRRFSRLVNNHYHRQNGIGISSSSSSSSRFWSG